MLTYISALVILAIVLVGQIYGIHGLYYRMPLYDIPMHILGGLGIGLFAAAFIRSRSYVAKFPRISVMLWVVAAGIVWEMIEIYLNINGYAFGTHAYYVDTIKDFIDDLIGGGLAIVLALNAKK